MKLGCMIIDMQVGVCDPNAYHVNEVIENIQTLLTWCRKEEIEVMYVRHDDGYAPITKGDASWEIIEELSPHAKEMVFDKFYNSAFLKTEVQAYLQDKQIDTLLIVGMQSEYCMDATIKSAFEKGFQVIVPKDCTTTLDQENISAETLCKFYEQTIWKDRFAQVVTLSELCK